MTMRAVISVLGITLLLTACAQGGGGGSSSGPVTLRYALWDANQQPAMQDIANAFHQSHSNINIKVEVTPFAQYWTKLQAAATGGSAPDVFWMNGPNFIKYASNGQLLAIDQQIKSDSVDLGNYPQSLVDLYTYGGHHYALPKDFDTVGLWYNKKLFDAAALKYPDSTWTWDTFNTNAQKLTDASKGVWGVAAQFANQEAYYNTIYQAGGQVISKDHKRSGYDMPETIAGIAFWTDLINRYHASPTQQQMTETQPVQLFEAGKVAMLTTGDWNAIEFAKNSYTAANADVTVLPQGKQRATVIHGLGNVVYAKTQHASEAWQFAKFLSDKTAAGIQASTGTVIPAYKDSQTAWVSAYKNFHVQAYIDELPYAVSFPTSKDTAVWQTDDEQRILLKAWTGQESAAAAGAEMAQAMNKALSAEH